MKLLKIKGLDSTIQITSGKIVQIVIENNIFYRNLIFDIAHNVEDRIIYSINYTLKDPYVHSLLLKSFLHIDYNDKKILNIIYKEISKSNTSKNKENLNSINTEILNILEDISLDIPVPIKYNLNIEIEKLLALYNFSFEVEENISYLELFLNYLKINREIKQYDFIISFGLIDFFDQEEISLLKTELELMNLSIIDIKSNDQNAFEIEKVVIDSDLCEI